MATQTGIRAQIKQVTRALVALLACVFSGAAFAQNEQEGPSTKRMEAAIQVSKSGGTAGTTQNISRFLGALPSLPGVDPLKNKKEGGEEKEADLGRNIQLNNNIILPPLKGFRQLADAAPIKEMYKELINKEVPVLFQTMMMVENGAATGFIGSMGAVSNLMNNTIQTQQFQLQLMDLTDTTGQMKYAYAGGINKAIKDGAKTWPQALYMVNGDSAKDNGGSSAKFSDLQKSEPFTLIGLPSNQLKKNDPNNKTGDGSKQLLTELLFATKEGGADTEHDNKEIEDLKKEYKDMVGDLELEIEKGQGDTDQIGRLLKVNYKKAEPKDDKQRWGLQKKVYKESDKVWKSLNKMLKELCEFKKTNENMEKGPTQKEIPANKAGFWDEKTRKNASAPDITVTAFMMDEIWAAFQPKGLMEGVKCEEEFKADSKFPDGTNFQQPDEKDPESCSGGQGDEIKPCLRNRIMVHMASMIGRSRAYHSYMNLYLWSSRFAKDQATTSLNEQLFQSTFGGNDANMYSLIDQNHDLWVSFVTELGRYMQSQYGSGANLSQRQSNALPAHNSGGYNESKP
jgi:hypothetical protein